MKIISKSISLIMVVVMVFTLCSCKSREIAQTDEEDSAAGTESVVKAAADVKTTEEEITEEETTADISPEEKYLEARKAFYNKACEQMAEHGETDELMAYFVDLNSDGFDDIVYNAKWYPDVAVYNDGEFVNIECYSDVCIGGAFPSGRNSGLFIEPQKGIIIIRYGGHTEGTALYNGAEAFQIYGTATGRLWIYATEGDVYINEEMTDEEWDAAAEQCFNDFEEVYKFNTTGYNLTDYYEVREKWTEN